ncbi:MAG: bifunctional pyr operon transcriptional regulator/uracil phosphoribosyltransferase PyrR [Actinomycetota bacterium]
MGSRTVLSSDDIGRAITRIAHEILESNHGTDDLVILGIPTRGVLLAERIAEIIRRNGSALPADFLGRIDITLHRDDLSTNSVREITPTVIPMGGIDDKVVVIVDDVLYTGRTVRAALDALNAIGRPRAVRLAVLVDRGHRQLPIRADFVGKNLPTAKDERVFVQLSPVDSTDAVMIEK